MLHTTNRSGAPGHALPGFGRALAFGLIVALATAPAFAIDFYFVTTTADSGPGSLRQAILDSNAVAPDGEPDRIVFNIPGAGVRTIQPSSALPSILGEDVTLDGLTQPGADCDSWPATLRIQLSGTQAGDVDGLRVLGRRNTIQGLVINDFEGQGIQLPRGAGDAGDHVVRCNYIGTNVFGSAARPNAGGGVFVDRAEGVRIGGTSPLDTNLLSGNGGPGILTTGDGSVIQGNFIGTNALGTLALPNERGITVSSTTGVVIGGLFGVGGNVIAGNTLDGIRISGSRLDATRATAVIGNWIGLNTALQILPNETGVRIRTGAIESVIGVAAPGGGNFIQGNLGHGVVVEDEDTVSHLIAGNSMAANGGLGIKLGSGDEPLENDPGDGDEGPNRGQNHPEIEFAILDDVADEMHVVYSVDTDPTNADYDLSVNFYLANLAGDEGILWIENHGYPGGFETAVLPFPFDAAALAAAGGEILATATDQEGNTSEFGPAIPVWVPEPASATLLGSGLLGLLGLVRARLRRRP